MAKRIFTGLLFFSLTFSSAYTQSVSGIVNHYLKVEEVFTDRVRVENSSELGYFSEGDKVMLIQMTGATFYLDSRTFQGYMGLRRGCGRFEILQVDEIITGANNYVTFTDDLDYPYDAGEKIQLIKILEGDKITVNGPVTSKDWDGSSGGIVAIIGLDTIVIQNTIDVSGKGFRGGQPENGYNNGCRTSPDTINFLASETGRAGNKGEGIVSVSWPYVKGASFALTGGGGGNGLYSGGGGGSNFKAGGKGGKQSGSCIVDPPPMAFGGLDLELNDAFYEAGDTAQILMGGGGGAGTENTALSRTGSAGGDGGGIVILITETLVSNNGTIRANGQSVSGTVNASGGGGGGGGAVLIDAARYSTGTLNIEIKGGNGGSTGNNCTGSGGGGGGGVLWYSGASLPGSAVINNSSGTPGAVTEACIAHQGGDALNGVQKSSLIIPLNGFLFNTIRGKQSICAGQQPGKITGSNPKGGDGNYTYKWISSTDSITWDTIAGAVSRDYQPPVLTATTYYSRIVYSEGIIDVSRAIKILVYPAISNNTITSSTETICYGKDALITGTTPPALTGGDNANYIYKWLSSSDNITYDTIAGNTYSMNTGSLTSTKYYKRYVKSTAYCTHTSSPLTITVLPSIANNTFYTSDTLICEGFDPGSLNIRNPSGGQSGSYLYTWQRYSTGTWQTVASTAGYDPGVLTDSSRFRRIVFSGSGNACKDTSPIKLIHVLPVIAANTITTDSLHYCAGDIPQLILGSAPTGGTGTYTYQWQIGTTGNWSNLAGATGKNYTPAVMVDRDTMFRRIVFSGVDQGTNVCQSASSPVSLDVMPYIINHLGLPDETICQFMTPSPFNPSTAVSGGINIYAYHWITKPSGSTSWNDIAGAITPDYASGPLEISTLFARKVTSGICEQISDTVSITVYPLIADNSIDGAPYQYTCFNTSITLTGSVHAGGNASNYAYIWESSADGLTWTQASSPETDLNFATPVLTDSMYYRRVVYSSAAGKECSDASDSVLIRINPLPSGDVISAVDTVCYEETDYIVFTVTGGKSPYDVTVGEAPVVFTKINAAGDDSVAISLTANHTIRMIEIRDDNDCLANLSGNTHQVAVTVMARPQAEAGPGGEVCSNRFMLSATPSISGSSGLWSVDRGTFDDPASPSTGVTLDDAEDNYGAKTITWAETYWHCTDTDSVIVLFDRQYTSVDAGADQTLDFVYTTRLEGSSPDPGTGTWIVVKGTGILDDLNLPNATVTELDDENLLRWTVKNGVCPELRDSVTIIVKDLVTPKGFTPNGDGINDVFVIPASRADRIEITIINRDGVVVFGPVDYTKLETGWNGEKDKIPLPEGTYYYIMRIWVQGKTNYIEKKSFVEILR